jgi:hypothetical protein
MQNGQVIDVKEIKPQRRTLDAHHSEYAKFSPAEREAKARAKLRERINVGQKAAMVALERIQREVPADRIVRARALDFVARGDGSIAAVLPQGERGGRLALGLHKHARSQLAQRVGLPIKFMNEMLAEGAWGQDLVAHNLAKLAGNGTDEKLLVRAVGDEVRGVLSSSYRTDDSRPALDSLLEFAREVNAVVVQGHALDTRVSFKIMKGEPVEIFPGEWAIIGLDYRTSDYGNGARELLGWIERLLCLNGCVVTTNFRRVHLGGRIESDVDFSSRTKKLNEQYTRSATRDMAKALLGDGAIEKMVTLVRSANEAALDPDAALATLKKSVNKEEEKLIVEKYNSPDVELLPAGNTAWRFSNAISWLAGQVEDQDRRLDLERLAGQVVEDAAKKAA